MYDGGKILLGSGLLVVAALWPFWRSVARARPDLALAETTSRCLESAETMRATHMKLLDQWRTDVVRADSRDYVAPDGRKFEKSLTRTCLRCHKNTDLFCTPCHDYVGVSPTCFRCHVAPGARAR